MFFANEIIFPKEIAQALASSHLLDKNAAAALGELWPKLAKELGENKIAHYSSENKLVKAYSAYYLAVNLLKPALILEEYIQLSGGQFPARLKVLDFGAGPGTAYWGLAWWAEQHGIKLEYLGFEASAHFIAEAKRLSSAVKSFAPAAQANWHKANASDLNYIELAKEHQPNLILFSNSIGEIFSTAAAMQAKLDEMLRYMRARASEKNPFFFLCIEPGTQRSARRLLEWRQILLMENSFPYLLPCLDSRPCGALEKSADWCHEEINCQFPDWLNDFGRTAGLQKEALVFSYLFLPMGPIFANWPSSEWRMVSQRLERKGQTEAWFCTSKGKICARVQKAKTNDANKEFLQIKRGDIIAPLDLGEKKDVLEMKTAKQGAWPPKKT